VYIYHWPVGSQIFYFQFALKKINKHYQNKKVKQIKKRKADVMITKPHNLLMLCLFVVAEVS